jgi:hypothetical protein
LPLCRIITGIHPDGQKQGYSLDYLGLTGGVQVRHRTFLFCQSTPFVSILFSETRTTVPDLFQGLFDSCKLISMRKTLLLVAFALTMLGSVVGHADPPLPFCPPFCGDGSTSGTGLMQR